MEKLAKKIRLETLKELQHLGFGHYGGALSIVEILAVLYEKHMRVFPNQPKSPDRDFLILSKGHGGPALYATLAIKGFFPKEMLETLNQNGTHLPSHPDCNLTPGVDMTTGSLGQGISAAAGIAYYHKTQGLPNQVYCILGDGELNEGQCWEAIQFIAHHELSNLTIIVDDNKKQLDGWTKDISNPFDFVEKMKAFGLESERVDGHDVYALDRLIEKSKTNAKPFAIIMDTVKAKGVPLLELKKDNHHIRPSQEEEEAIKTAIEKLEEELGYGIA